MTPGPHLDRRLGLTDAVVIGLGSMVGAGIFAVLSPAAVAAGTGLLAGLVAAALVAYLNATSTARCAARYPESGGAYLYGRQRLGPFWAYLAGWSFVVGKTSSCAAMALTVGTYAWPGHAHLAAVVSVLALTVVNGRGIRKSALVTRIIVVAVVTGLTAVAVLGLTAPGADLGRFNVAGASIGGVLQATGLLFFAFAGYARIATLGEEVRDPGRTIPRAIQLTVAIAFVVYSIVAIAALSVLGAQGLADSAAPIADTVRAAGAIDFVPAVRVLAVLAALGSLLSLLLGISRTVFALARDHYLPRQLSAVHSTLKTPLPAEVAVAAVVSVLAGTTEVGGAIGFSSFAVLVYYAIAHAAAWTLGGRTVATLGLMGCLVVAFALPLDSVVLGTAVLVLGAIIYAVQQVQKKNPA
jgi:basic amino acid/polyamine antiporter, APA family